MKLQQMILPILLGLVSCDRNEELPLRADAEYRRPSSSGKEPPLDQAVPQGAPATGDSQTRTGDGVAGGQKPTSGDHVGAGGNAAGNPSGAPTPGGTGRPQEKK